MLARLRKSMDEKDQGFTLIELLVVMIIIGILAAIAIPVFLNQRTRAVESSMQSDARTVALELDTYFVDNQAYPGAIAQSTNSIVIPAAGGNPAVTVTLSDNNTAQVFAGVGGDSYCVTIDRAATAPSQDAGPVYYNSRAGGLTNTACA